MYAKQMRKVHPYRPVTKPLCTTLTEAQKNAQQDQPTEDTECTTLALPTKDSSSVQLIHPKSSLSSLMTLSGQPKIAHFCLPFYTNQSVSVVADNPLDTVSISYKPSLISVDPRLWNEFSNRVLIYNSLRYIGHKVTVIVENPYTSVFQNTIATGTPSEFSITEDFEFLKTCETHMHSQDKIPVIGENPDFFVQQGAKHTKAGQPMCIRTHLTKGWGYGEAWRPRGAFFTNAQLAAANPPNTTLDSLISYQQDLGSGTNALAYPHTYQIAVTGWPNIVTGGPAEAFMTTWKRCGFNFSMYVETYWQAKAFTGN